MLDFKPFRFWCQKVLPAVYDDSLSYYELLCKVVAYLNDMSSQTETQFNNLEKEFNELKSFVDNYFNNLDVQDEINKKLDDMANSGVLNIFLSGIYTPEMFGAKGDGITNDTAAIQKACTFNNVNLSGNYLITDPIIIRNNINIFGGGTITINTEYSDSYLNHCAFRGVDLNNITIKNISIITNALGIDLRGCNNINIQNIRCTTEKYSIYITDSVANESYSINISNVSINNDVSIGSSDGIHINGGCHDIFINNVNGTSGDDFIALNAIEGVRKNILNVIVNNIKCSGYAGVRIYGGANNIIENVKFNNCIINSENGVRITNIVAFKTISYDEPTFKNIEFNNCELNNSRSIFLTYVNCDVIFNNCKLTTTANPCIGCFNPSQHTKIELNNCLMSTNSNSYMQDCVLSVVPDNCRTYVNISIRNCTLDKNLILAFGKDKKNITICNCELNKTMFINSINEINLIVHNSIINTTIMGYLIASGYYEIINCILNSELMLNNVDSSSNTTFYIKGTIVNNNNIGTFINFGNSLYEYVNKNMEGAFQMSKAPQNEGVIFKRYSSNGFMGYYIYNNGWKQFTIS